MTFDDLAEAVGVLQAVIPALQASVPAIASRAGAGFRYSCGDLLAQAPGLINAAALGAPLRACFDGAVAAGATLNGLVGVRNAVLGLTLDGDPARYVAGGCYGLALGAEARVICSAAYASSDVALGALAVFGGAVGACQDWAANYRLPALYQSMVALGAAVSRDLTTRAAPLPKLTTYGYPRGTTSHALAFRLYGDANRADELRAEGGVIHPAFMPASGPALTE